MKNEAGTVDTRSGLVAGATGALSQHPLSAAYPAMSDQDYRSIVSSIGEIGQIEPGVTFDGMVLDGWHRYRACLELGIGFKSEELTNGVDPVAFVRARNDLRRHLTASQRAVAEVRLSDWLSRGRQVSLSKLTEPNGSVFKPKSSHGDLQEESNPPRGGFKSESAGRSSAQMARDAGVGVRTIERAKVAEAAGLGDKVRDGELTVAEAAGIATKKPVNGSRDPFKSEPIAHEIFDAPKKPTELERLQERCARLEAELAKAHEDIEALEMELSAANAVEDPEAMQELVRQMAEQREQIRTLEKTRDRYMNENGALAKTVKQLQKRLGER